MIVPLFEHSDFIKVNASGSMEHSAKCMEEALEARGQDRQCFLMVDCPPLLKYNDSHFNYNSFILLELELPWLLAPDS